MDRSEDTDGFELIVGIPVGLALGTVDGLALFVGDDDGPVLISIDGAGLVILLRSEVVVVPTVSQLQRDGFCVSHGHHL